MRKSIPSKVDKKSRVPDEEKRVQSPQEGEKNKSSLLHCFVLVNVTMYLAR